MFYNFPFLISLTSTQSINTIDTPSLIGMGVFGKYISWEIRFTVAKIAKYDLPEGGFRYISK